MTTDPPTRLEQLTDAVNAARAALDQAAEHLSEVRIADRDRRLLVEIFGEDTVARGGTL